MQTQRHLGCVVTCDRDVTPTGLWVVYDGKFYEDVTLTGLWVVYDGKFYEDVTSTGHWVVYDCKILQRFHPSRQISCKRKGIWIVWSHVIEMSPLRGYGFVCRCLLRRCHPYGALGCVSLFATKMLPLRGKFHAKVFRFEKLDMRKETILILFQAM